MSCDNPAQIFAVRVARMTAQAPELLTRLLAHGGDYADIFLEHTVAHQYSLRQRRTLRGPSSPAETDRRHVDGGAGLRVLDGFRQGFSATGDVSTAGLRLAADDAARRLEAHGQGRAAAGTIDPVDTAALPPDSPDCVAASEKTFLLRVAVDAAFSLDERVAAVAADYQDRVRRVLVIPSEGPAVVVRQPLVGLRVEVVGKRSGEGVSAHAIAGAASGLGYFFDVPAEEVARQAVALMQLRVEAEDRPAPVGEMPVVIDAGWGGVWLHEAVGHLLEADVAVQRMGWRSRLDERIAGPDITLVDDATLAGARGSMPHDDEGLATGKSVLLEAGVLRRLITDRRHARAYDLPPTASGRRQDFRHAPLPRMSNLLLEAGPATTEDLIAEAGEGLFVQAIGNGRLDPTEDVFSFEVLVGHRIEGGRLTAPVGGVRVVGEASSVLESIAGVGNDARRDTARGMCEKAGQVVPVSVGSPAVLITGLTVEREH